MSPRQPTHGLTIRVVFTAVLIMSAVIPVRAQVFGDLKMSRVDYSKADLEPRKACTALGQYKAKDIVQIAATMKDAAAGVPAFCDVMGVLSPEIAFEVSLPSRLIAKRIEYGERRRAQAQSKPQQSGRFLIRHLETLPQKGGNLFLLPGFRLQSHKQSK